MTKIENRALIVIMHSVTSTVRLNRYLISYAKALHYGVNASRGSRERSIYA